MMRVTRLGLGPDGTTRFDEIEIDQPHLVAGVGLQASESLASPAVHLVTLPAGFDWPAHPSSRRLFMVVLSGTVEVTLPSGESRKSEPGSAFVSEDIDGKLGGHRSRTVGGPAELVWITLPQGNPWQIGP
jgi:hypothetical protein